jgi:hypothetical protein
MLSHYFLPITRHSFPWLLFYIIYLFIWLVILRLSAQLLQGNWFGSAMSNDISKVCTSQLAGGQLVSTF